MYKLTLALLLLATPAWAVDLLWDTPVTRRCYQHYDRTSGAWSGMRETADCPSDNAANECAGLAGWEATTSLAPSGSSRPAAA
jgi:hypothetical protein